MFQEEENSRKLLMAIFIAISSGISDTYLTITITLRYQQLNMETRASLVKSVMTAYLVSLFGLLVICSWENFSFLWRTLFLTLTFTIVI